MEPLDKIVEHLGRIDVTLMRNTVTLEEHVKRTNILEDRIKPIEKHVFMLQGALKLIGGLAILAEAARLLWK